MMVRAPFVRLPKKAAPSSSLYGQPARPFVVQPKAEETDLEGWQRRAEAFGHRLRPSGGGKSLPDGLRRKMEGSFGTDFSGVRIHEDHQASSIGAVAYAQGDHIHFAPGMFQPHDAQGEQIVGHELAHVVQQRSGRVSLPPGGGLPINVDETLEKEADRLGTEAASGRKASAPAAGQGATATPAAPVAQPMLRKGFTTLMKGKGGGGSGGGGGEDWQRQMLALVEMAKRSKQSSVKIDPKTYNPKKDFPKGNKLYRADDFPFHSVQPKYGTLKSFINPKGELTPVKERGRLPPALHVHGKPKDKKRSPFTSVSSNLGKVSSYGKHLLELDPEELEGQILNQEAIQEDIQSSKDPRLDETAKNVTQEGKPLWKPEWLESSLQKEQYTYRERASLNSQRDEESLIKGPTSNVQLWRFISAKTFGKQFENLDVEKLGREQGRDPRSLHKEGFRIPLDEHGVEYMGRQERYRQQQEEVERERREDEEYRLSLTKKGTTRRGGKPQPGREEQYYRQIERMRAKLKKKKDDGNKGE